jgi:hypothetical protein
MPMLKLTNEEVHVLKYALGTGGVDYVPDHVCGSNDEDNEKADAWYSHHHDSLIHKIRSLDTAPAKADTNSAWLQMKASWGL